MKLSRRQTEMVNEIIQEEIQSVLMNRATVKGPMQEALGAGVDVYEIAGSTSQKLRDTWAKAYSNDDPTMAAAGADGWEAQCDQAAEELLNMITEAIEVVEGRLVAGEFDDNGANTRRDRTPRF